MDREFKSFRRNYYWFRFRRYKEKSTWKVPENADFAWHLDKVTKSITNLLKEKNAAYGNTALNPLGIFSKLGASEAIKARIDDKLARIANKGLNDDTEDTARDLVGYLLLLLMALEREGSNYLYEVPKKY